MNVYNGQLKRYKNGVTLFHETLSEIYDKDYMHVLYGAVHKVCHAPGGRGSEKVWQFVTGEGGKDHVTSHFQFFHNSLFYVLFHILSCI